MNRYSQPTSGYQPTVWEILVLMLFSFEIGIFEFHPTSFALLLYEMELWCFTYSILLCGNFNSLPSKDLDHLPQYCSFSCSQTIHWTPHSSHVVIPLDLTYSILVLFADLGSCHVVDPACAVIHRSLRLALGMWIPMVVIPAGKSFYFLFFCEQGWLFN